MVKEPGYLLSFPNKVNQLAQNNIQNLKMNCLGFYYFWREQKLLAQTEDICDVFNFL